MALSENPRLGTRFALTTLVAFIVIGVVLALLISSQVRTREEQAATDHALFVARSVLPYELTPQDVAAPIDPASERYAQLRAEVVNRLLQAPVVRLKLWRHDGTVLFSDEPRLDGRSFGAEEDLQEAFSGHPHSGVSDLSDAENVFERQLFSKLFETYVPLYLRGSHATGEADAVAELYIDYAGIQRQIDQLFRTLSVTLVLGLGTLYLLLLPLTRRVAKTLSSQNQKLAQQADQLRELLAREQETVAELRELNELKDGFVAMASHEVRTPLTSIVGYAKTLRRSEFSNDPAVREEFLEAIERQGDRLSRLVENLLAASRIEDERGALTLERFSLAEVVEDVLAALGPRGRRVQTSFPSSLPLIESDRQRLELIMTNLLDNALKFSSPGTSCEVTARREGSSVAISVRDRGIGIAPEHINRIFDRFYQVDSSVTRGYGGVGLGLTLVKELTTSLGGTVEVSSAPGQGSAFVVKFPITPRAMANARPESSRQPEAAASR
jgi:signal transduction histidine kinase